MFFKKLATIFAVIFFATINLANAADLRPMSHRLWNGLNAEEIELIKKIITATNNKNYSEALNYVATIKSKESPEANKSEAKIGFAESLGDIVLWHKFSNSNASGVSFSDISRFINDNPFYPNLGELKRNAEKLAIANNISYRASEKYFKSNPAISRESKLYLLKSEIDYLSYLKSDDEERTRTQEEILSKISKIYIEENFTVEEEKKFLDHYLGQLTEKDFFQRIERLLWEDRINDARRIMNYVNEDAKKLFSAIIELQNSTKYIENTILSVPRKLRSNETLTYHRILWHKAKGDVDEIIDLMVDLPTKSTISEKWWSLRRFYAREMIKQKEFKKAYALMAPHNLPKTHADYWEAEWMSGWIALRFLKEPKDAYEHFYNLHQNVTQPVTLARAEYWLGMASEAMKRRDWAIEWYKKAAKYPTFFYGQLAIHKHRAIDPLGAQSDIVLPGDPDITGRDIYNISQSRAAQTAYILSLLGDKTGASKIFEWLVNTAPTEGQVAVVMKLVNELNDRQLDAKIARAAARKNVFFIKDKFQIIKEVSGDDYAPLVHAIIKQESGFAPTAVSHVGALGFMQLMPDTAKLVAKEMGIKYDRTKLATNITYNVQLGSFYIKKLINQFDGSEMLAIASYNAGPNATARWIREFYDPRKEKDIDKIIDWIELITYSETRNYVQRIMENLIVYKYLMSRSNYDNIS